jgi:hypothetical protein
MGVGSELAPPGIAYRASFSYDNENQILELQFVGWNNYSFLYRPNGTRLAYVCGEPDAPMLCTKTPIGGPIALDPEKEKCTNALPYCAARLRQDENFLERLLQTSLSWRYSHGTLVLVSQVENAQVQFQRRPPTSRSTRP